MTVQVAGLRDVPVPREGHEASSHVGLASRAPVRCVWPAVRAGAGRGLLGSVGVTPITIPTKTQSAERDRTPQDPTGGPKGWEGRGRESIHGQPCLWPLSTYPLVCVLEAALPQASLGGSWPRADLCWAPLKSHRDPARSSDYRPVLQTGRLRGSSLGSRPVTAGRWQSQDLN